RREALQDRVKTLPRAHATAPEMGMALALWQRDLGDEDKAHAILATVEKLAPNPELERLLKVPTSEWPATLRDLLRLVRTSRSFDGGSAGAAPPYPAGTPRVP